MKGLYLALLPLLAVMALMSCQKNQEEQKAAEPVEVKSEEVMGFAQADSPPLFAGCDVNATKDEQIACFQKGIMKHVQENFKFPEKVKEQKMAGKLYVNFKISETGDIRDTKILRGLEAETEEEKAAAKEADKYAIELVESIPEMTPAIKEGKKVAVQFTLPINLKYN